MQCDAFYSLIVICGRTESKDVKGRGEIAAKAQ